MGQHDRGLSQITNWKLNFLCHQDIETISLLVNFLVGRESGDMQKLPTVSTLDSSSQVSFLSTPNSMFLLSNSIQHTQATYIVQSTWYSEIVKRHEHFSYHNMPWMTRNVIHTYHMYIYTMSCTCTWNGPKKALGTEPTLHMETTPHMEMGHMYLKRCAHKPNNSCNKLSKL